eukprot:2624797-Pyramimonas_sp.AAC.1
MRSVDCRGLPPRSPGSWFWTRGMAPRSCFPPVPPRDDSGRWHIQYGSLDNVTGDIYTDGACRKAWYWPEATRAGWGFV